jgi:hypothetical protein
MTVSGAPTLKWSQKLITTPETATLCTTIRLAIEPSTVKLPARVEANVLQGSHKRLDQQHSRYIADQIRQHRHGSAEHGNTVQPEPADGREEVRSKKHALYASDYDEQAGEHQQNRAYRYLCAKR